MYNYKREMFIEKFPRQSGSHGSVSVSLAGHFTILFKHIYKHGTQADQNAVQKRMD